MLTSMAWNEGCSGVVLGQYRDDILETFFMNLFHGGSLATMPPKLLNKRVMFLSIDRLPVWLRQIVKNSPVICDTRSFPAFYVGPSTVYSKRE